MEKARDKAAKRAQRKVERQNFIPGSGPEMGEPLSLDEDDADVGADETSDVES
jgi:hypothetical protein